MEAINMRSIIVFFNINKINLQFFMGTLHSFNDIVMHPSKLNLE